VSREFHRNVCAQLGLDPGVDAETVYTAAREVGQRSRIAEACGLPAGASDDEIVAKIEAAKQRKPEAVEVVLPAADRRAIDAVMVGYASGGVEATLKQLGINTARPRRLRLPLRRCLRPVL
jgi:hypothetical protein